MVKINFNSNIFKINPIIIGALYTIIGVLLAVFTAQFLVIIGYIVGVICLGFGVVYVINYIKNKNDNFALQLAYGLVLIVSGIYILFVPTLPTSIAPFFMGLVVLIIGVMQLQHSLELKELKYAKWYYTLISSILIIILSIVVLINPFQTIEILVSFGGIAMAISGVSMIVSSILLHGKGKSVK